MPVARRVDGQQAALAHTGRGIVQVHLCPYVTCGWQPDDVQVSFSIRPPNSGDPVCDTPDFFAAALPSKYNQPPEHAIGKLIVRACQAAACM